QTWDMLAKQKQETLRLKTAALGDRFRDVLFLSVPAAKTAAIHSHEKAPEPFSLFRAADELARSVRTLQHGAPAHGNSLTLEYVGSSALQCAIVMQPSHASRG